MRDLRLLIIDDHNLTRIMLRNTLKSLGFEENQIEEAENGKLGLQKMDEAHQQNRPITAVFCDWVMPEMNGIDFLLACKTHPIHKGTYVIMVTGESEQGQVIQALTSGADEYIVKPILAEVVTKKIQKLLKKLNQKKAA